MCPSILNNCLFFLPSPFFFYSPPQKVDRDGLPLFWNEQPSAPRLGPTSGLYYYDGQRLPRPWKDPPVEWGAGPALYPHVPEGCGDQCQKIPLNAVRGFITCVRLRSMQE